MTTKKEVINAVATASETQKVGTEKVLDGLAEVIREELVNGEGVFRIPFVGTLSVGERNCRNPQTGETMVAKTVKFKPYGGLKNAVKGK